MTLDLFDQPQAKLLHRSGDPDTSRAAAHEMVSDGSVGRMMRVALGIIINQPYCTATEYDHVWGRGQGSIRKRLNDLRLAGYAEKCDVRRCSLSGRSAHTWRATGKGIAFYQSNEA